jgi:hypothetical protein
MPSLTCLPVPLSSAAAISEVRAGITFVKYSGHLSNRHPTGLRLRATADSYTHPKTQPNEANKMKDSPTQTLSSSWNVI